MQGGADSVELKRTKVTYRMIDSAVGRLLLASTPAGLVRLAFDHGDHEATLAELARRVSPDLIEASVPLDPALRQLDEYFAGSRRRFDLPVDLRLASPFRRSVLEHLLTIPYGATASYAKVAANVGNPRAVRAVGSACATNPVALVVPCHRVVRSDGSMGNYGGGLEAKRLLLKLEAEPR